LKGGRRPSLEGSLVLMERGSRIEHLEGGIGKASDNDIHARLCCPTDIEKKESSKTGVEKGGAKKDFRKRFRTSRGKSGERNLKLARKEGINRLRKKGVTGRP